MTKCFFLKDLDETPLNGALRWTRTISLAIISRLLKPLELPGQNYCGFFATAAMNRPQLFLHLQISYGISGVQL